MEAIVHSLEPITLVGAGQVAAGDLDAALTIAPRVVAADGGVATLMQAGVHPEAVIGDFDSLPKNVKSELPAVRFHPAPDQNYTDFDKSLRLIEAPVVIGVGFTGGRMDHQMAALHTLVVRADRPCVLLGAREVIFHCPPRLTIPTIADEVVSLFPLTTVTGRSEGLHWPLEGLTFAPDVYVGTSNRALGPCVIEMDAPGMLAIVPRRLLAEVTAALAALPMSARWPARAE